MNLSQFRRMVLIKAQADSECGESLLPNSWVGIFLLDHHTMEGILELSGASFIRFCPND
jgi:hypothetical protein